MSDRSNLAMAVKFVWDHADKTTVIAWKAFDVLTKFNDIKEIKKVIDTPFEGCSYDYANEMKEYQNKVHIEEIAECWDDHKKRLDNGDNKKKNKQYLSEDNIKEYLLQFNTPGQEKKIFEAAFILIDYAEDSLVIDGISGLLRDDAKNDFIRSIALEFVSRTN